MRNLLVAAEALAHKKIFDPTAVNAIRAGHGNIEDDAVRTGPPEL